MAGFGNPFAGSSRRSSKAWIVRAAFWLDEPGRLVVTHEVCAYANSPDGVFACATDSILDQAALAALFERGAVGCVASQGDRLNTGEYLLARRVAVGPLRLVRSIFCITISPKFPVGVAFNITGMP